ncbi:MAG: glycoside hydrolase family 2 TIM barrel-domain containing protein [Candidatus Omnitrophica bacterium]|nr:glycoside hydrolase family 2 TIM barrel-domain containing protein [Candidatus Omnitrophota bacterium]
MKKNTVSVLVAFVFVVLAGSVLASNNLPQKAKQETIEKIKEKNTPKIDSKKVKIDLTKTEENGYKLSVNGKPFIIKGVIYNPTPVGKGYDYDFFTDENKPWLVDGPLMQEMGINCVRIYSVSDDLSKVKLFIRDMYEKYGIFTMVSDWLGLWDYPQSNYADPKFRERSKERIVRIVKELKDEPGLLMWVIGNENNYTFSGKMG